MLELITLKMTQQFTKAHCNTCSSQTNHFILHSAKREWREEVDDGHYLNETALYDMVQCCGCDEIKLKVRAFGPWPDCETDYYPPAIFRRRPDWMHQLQLDSFSGGVKESLASLLGEVYRALQNNMPRLAVMGVRAVLEVVMTDKVGDNQSFAKNLEKFTKEGYIGTRQADRIMAVLDAGGAAIHRGYEPTTADVISMVNLTENLVESIYFHDDSIQEVAKRVPQRPRAQPKSGV
jgi:hypothetical protein